MTHDIMVAGLGVMGSAIARRCARAGLGVIGCDALQPPHERGSSHGESRIIRAAYFEDPVYAPLAQRAFELWRELETETGTALLRVTGGLNIGPADAMLVTGALASAREHGIAHSLLDHDELATRFPGLRITSGHVAVFEPEAGVLDPERCVAAQIASARAAGADLRLDEPLTGWRHTGDAFTVETTRGKYTAKTLILAVGAWMPRFRSALPLTVARQPVFWFDPIEPALYAPDRLPHYLIEFERGRIFYGFPDLGNGLKCAIHHEGSQTSPDDVDRSVREAELEEVRSLAAQFLPGAAGPLRRSAVCLYTNTPDGHFIIDRDETEDALWLVSACSGHGFKFAPAIAELLVDALTNGTAMPEVFTARR